MEESTIIVSHEGPLPKLHRHYKKCAFNFLVEWNPSGRITRVPINMYDQKKAAEYAKEHQLLDTEGFKRFKRFFKGEETSTNKVVLLDISDDDGSDERKPAAAVATKASVTKLLAQESRRKLNTVASTTEKCFKELKSKPTWPQIDVGSIILNEVKSNKSGRQLQSEDKKRAITQINLLCRDPSAAQRLMAALNCNIDDSKYVLNISYTAKDHMARLGDDDQPPPKKKKKLVPLGELPNLGEETKLPKSRRGQKIMDEQRVIVDEKRNNQRTFDPNLAAANPHEPVTFAQMQMYMQSVAAAQSTANSEVLDVLKPKEVTSRGTSSNKPKERGSSDRHTTRKNYDVEDKKRRETKHREPSDLSDRSKRYNNRYYESSNEEYEESPPPPSDHLDRTPIHNMEMSSDDSSGRSKHRRERKGKKSKKDRKKRRRHRY
jgi:hypothetical protein